MTSVAHAGRLLPSHPWLATVRRRTVRDHPQWWILAIAGIAWVVLISASRTMPAHHAATHAASGPLAIRSVASETAGWMLMVAAMMFPLLWGPAEATAARSLWRRRHRAIAGFLAGYAACWLLPGIVVAVALSLFRSNGWVPSGTAAATAFALAALWQGTRWRARAVRSCHRTIPLAPTGWKADRDCVRYGWTTGLPCIVSCGPAMIACTLAGHGLFTLAAATAVGLAERHANRPDQRILAGALALLSVVQLALPGVS